MSKDKVTYQSLITLAKTKASAITDSLTKGSLITDALVLQSPIGIESIDVDYSNGVVTNSIFGEIAVFDFDVVANFDGPVVFTVDWGAEIGETEINATLVDGVPQSLQTQIEIPEGVDTDQTIQVTDSLGGSYSVGYTVESPIDLAFKITINTALGTGDSFQLPLPSGQTYNFVVDWGDGNDDTITVFNQAETLHNYSGAFSGQVTITGKCGGWSFANGGDKDKLVSIDQIGNIGLDNVVAFVRGCTNLTSVVNQAIPFSSSITSLANFFERCSSLVSVPELIFSKLTSVTSASSCLSRMTSLITVPSELFRFNTSITNFALLFRLSSSLTTIPTDFFRYNVNATNFTQLCQTCTSLTTISLDIFRYNIAATTFLLAFQTCNSLVNLPNNMFFYNSLVTNYSSVFQNTINMVLPSVLFDTSNLNIVTTFVSFMNITSTGNSSTGTIQDIWNYTSATSANAFINQTALTNYGDIPDAWKGL